MNEETTPRIPLIGEKAPAFTAMTTQGVINFRKTTRASGPSCSAIRQISLPCVPPNS